MAQVSEKRVREGQRVRESEEGGGGGGDSTTVTVMYKSVLQVWCSAMWNHHRRVS